MYGKSYIAKKIYDSGKYIGDSVYKLVGGVYIPCKDKVLLFATPNISGGTDKVGLQTFDPIRPVKVVGNGVTYLENILLANLTLTYYDATTLTSVSSSFDGNGRFIIPINGIARLDVSNGSKYIGQELIRGDGGFNDILSDPINEIHLTLKSALATPATYDDKLISYMNEEGYTLSDGYIWADSLLTTNYPITTRIPYGCGYVGDETYTTVDGYNYVTLDGFAYIIKE